MAKKNYLSGENLSNLKEENMKYALFFLSQEMSHSEDIIILLQIIIMILFINLVNSLYKITMQESLYPVKLNRDRSKLFQV